MSKDEIFIEKLLELGLTEDIRESNIRRFERGNYPTDHDLHMWVEVGGGWVSIMGTDDEIFVKDHDRAYLYIHRAVTKNMNFDWACGEILLEEQR